MTRNGKSGKKAVTWLLILLLLGAGAAVLNLEVLRVKHIEVRGNEKVTADRIADSISDCVGENLFAADPGILSGQIETDPYLEVLSVKRALPDTLRVTVRERKPYAAVEYLNDHILVDEEGTLLELCSARSEELPPIVIRGIRIVSFIPGEPAGAEDPYPMQAVSKLLPELKKQDAGGWVTGIDMGNPDDIILDTVCGIEVHMGQARELREKVAWMDTVLQDLSEEEKTGVLDLTAIGTGAAFRQDERTK